MKPHHPVADPAHIDPALAPELDAGALAAAAADSEFAAKAAELSAPRRSASASRRAMRMLGLMLALGGGAWIAWQQYAPRTSAAAPPPPVAAVALADDVAATPPAEITPALASPDAPVDLDALVAAAPPASTPADSFDLALAHAEDALPAEAPLPAVAEADAAEPDAVEFAADAPASDLDAAVSVPVTIAAPAILAPEPTPVAYSLPQPSAWPDAAQTAESEWTYPLFADRYRLEHQALGAGLSTGGVAPATQAPAVGNPVLVPRLFLLAPYCSSNCSGDRYPSDECSRLRL